FCFGNILRNDFDELLEDECCRRTAEEVRVGVEACRDTCRYFDLCGGGSPSNKMSEHKSLASAETLFCRLSIQAPADAMIEFLQERSSRAAADEEAGGTDQGAAPIHEANSKPLAAARD